MLAAWPSLEEGFWFRTPHFLPICEVPAGCLRFGLQARPNPADEQGRFLTAEEDADTRARMHHTARRHMLEVCLGSSVAYLWLVCGQAEG